MKTIHAPAPRSFRWTVEKYDRLVARGFLDNQHVELLDGRIIQMPPKLEPHVAGVSFAAKAAGRAFGDGFYVRREAPLRQGTRSKPEPDIAVVPGNERDYLKTGPPADALLVIEVSDRTLRYDRGKKASIYARHRIGDYWIVNLVNRQIEVHRDPIADPAHKWGFYYNSIQIFKPGETVAPLAAPQSSVVVNDLLP
jgi:Uma2 family endonuclease